MFTIIFIYLGILLLKNITFNMLISILIIVVIPMLPFLYIYVYVGICFLLKKYFKFLNNISRKINYKSGINITLCNGENNDTKINNDKKIDNLPEDKELYNKNGSNYNKIEYNKLKLEGFWKAVLIINIEIILYANFGNIQKLPSTQQYIVAMLVITLIICVIMIIIYQIRSLKEIKKISI